jgi:glycosyltransferase involved in cell wall biosynthesis
MQVISSGILPIFVNNSFTEHLLTVSRFVKEKNIYFLLDAFSKLDQSNFIFTLIGYGAETQNIQNYAYKKLGLSENNIRFIIKPHKEIISYYYKSVDLFIFSSITETQGLVLAEAMSGGTPVIAVDATGSCDIVKNGFNGYLVNTVEQMIEKILQISSDEQLNKTMQYNAFCTAQLYNPAKTTQNLIDFYQCIIKNH